MSERNFFSELKRRNVYKVAVAYAVVAWLVIQIASTVLPTFHAPEWVVQTLIVIVALGFPIALVIAWAFEMTPEGLKRTEDVGPDEKIPQWSRRKFAALIVTVALIAAGLLVFQLVGTDRWAVRSGDDNGGHRSAMSLPVTEKSIAVLPFENLSDDRSNAYFADGIQDAILTKLASIADLKVISRTSTAKYKSKPEDLKAVSQQLGVATVLEGTVQKSGDKVRINVQLIDARADTHLWAKSYDGDAKDIFGVESEVSQQVADALRAKLSAGESKTLAKAPTQNAEAYDWFLKGEYEAHIAETTLQRGAFDRATASYRQAITQDPNFALAMARLVENQIIRHWYIEHLNQTQLEEIRKVADAALALAPDLAEAHIALGLFNYVGCLRYPEALAEFERAIQLQPNNMMALAYKGSVHRRQGLWKECLAEFEKALEQDPRNASAAARLASTYAACRMWKDAERVARHGLVIEPHAVDTMIALTYTIVSGSGEIEQARQLLATFPAENKLVTSALISFLWLVGDRADIYVMARDFDAALKVWENNGVTPADERRHLAARAAIHVLAGDSNQEQAGAERARALLEQRLQEQPQDTHAMVELSWVYLALKRNADAVKLARQTVELTPAEVDAWANIGAQIGSAEIQGRAGQSADAIAILRRLLATPGGGISTTQLKLDPVWDPIRNDPEFQQLLTVKEHVGP